MIGHVDRSRNVEHDFGCMSHFGFGGVECDTVHGEILDEWQRWTHVSKWDLPLSQRPFIHASDYSPGAAMLVGRCGTILFRTDIKISHLTLSFFPFLFSSPTNLVFCSHISLPNGIFLIPHARLAYPHSS